ncbi:DMT family transporter [Breoghania sp. L-A4]|uniref:DMT family transporter n=1 Tax=Breoghania sp. L-A4 TaxID=2304600 RepID=UPI000E35F193|nr:DMT family transporter [Breoghania sp. L-A4]AXS41739.1 DMT family transporter [Breoghania sp. L-A4]
MSDAVPVANDSAPAHPAGAEIGLAHAAMLLFALIISTSFPLGAAIASELDPVVLTLLRFVLATALFGGLVTARGGWYRPGLRQAGGYLWIGSLLALYFISMFEALRWTSAVNTSALFTLVPVVAAVVAYFLLGQRISRLQRVCLGLGAAGALVVLFGEDLAQLSAFRLGHGELVFIVGCVAYGTYIPFVRKAHGREPLVSFTFWCLAASTLILALASLPRLGGVDWTGLPSHIYLGIAYLAVFPTAITFYLSKYAGLRLPSGPLMGYTYLVPGFVVVEELILGGPWPGPYVIGGVLLTAIVTVILQIGGRR